MKTLFNRLLFTALICLCLLSTLLTGYFLGWKTAPRPALGIAPSPATNAAESAASKSEPAPSANGPVRQAGLDSLAPSEISALGLTNVLNHAWDTLRFGSDDSVAAAEVWQLIENLDARDLPTAFELACKLKGSRTRPEAIHMVLRRWAAADAPAALAGVAAQFQGEDRFRYMTSVLAQVAREEPTLALKAWREHYAHMDSPSHDSAVFPLTYVFPELARRDFDSAWAQLQQLNGKEKKYAVRGLTHLLQQESEPGRRLLEKLNERGNETLLGEARTEVVRNLARRGAVDEAEAWLAQQRLPAASRASLENEMAVWWAERDPRSAADWLAARSDSTELGDRLRGVINRWADWEPTEAGNWLNQVRGNGQSIDPAVQSFVYTIALKDPSAALSWTAAISDPTLRHETAAHLGQRFQRGGVSDATGLVQRSGLGQSDKEAILSSMRIR